MAKMIQPKIGEKMADFACGTGGFITSWLKELEPKVKDTEDREAYDDSIYGIEKKPFPYILCVTNMLLHGLDIPRVYHDNSLLRDVLDYTESDQFDVILMNPPYGGSEKADVKNHFPDDLASSETADLFMAVIMYRLKKNGRAAVILPDGFLFGLDNAKVNLKKKLLKEFNLHTVIRMPSSVFAPYTSITTNILFFDNTKPTEETWFYRLDMPSDRKHFSKTKPMELKHFDPVLEWWNDRQEMTVDGFDKSKCYTVEQIIDELGYNLDQCGYPREEEEILSPTDLIRRYQEERASLNAVVDRAIGEISNCLSVGDISSHTETANGALARLVEIDASFPDDMKKSMLQLSVQGKLVDQRPEDGTGEELFQQIQAEKQALIKAGKIKKDEPLPEISDEEIPFDIPDTWCWVRLGDCSSYTQRKEKVSPGDLTGDMWSLDLEDIEKGSGRIVQYCKVFDRKIAGDKVKFSKDQILYSKLRPYLKKVLVAPADGVCTGEIVPFTAYGGIDPQYIVYVLTCPHVDYVINSVTYGVKMPRVGTQTMAELLIPLPPLAEQKRIVAKLEEVLPLIDRLK
jgi:hypothetical protein